MKLSDIAKVVGQDLGSFEIKEINQFLKLKASEGLKYKIMGVKLGSLGYTVAIKSLTPEGLKVFTVNKVILIRLSEIESFEKAKPRLKREKRPPRPQKVHPPRARPRGDLTEDADDDGDSESLEYKRNPSRQKSFIPAKKPR